MMNILLTFNLTLSIQNFLLGTQSGLEFLFTKNISEWIVVGIRHVRCRRIRLASRHIAKIVDYKYEFNVILLE